MSKYPGQFSNVAILPVACPLVVYKFFGSVNKVDSHNKSRQPDLALDKLWVTQCGSIRLFTTVAMGMTITNFWKLFCYGVKRNHYEKLIVIREFSERLDLDCFNSTFSTDTGNPEKNMPTLDEVDEVETVSTCRALRFYRSISPFAAAINVYNITLKIAS